MDMIDFAFTINEFCLTYLFVLSYKSQKNFYLSNIKQYSWLEYSIFSYANLSQLEVLIILWEMG